VYPRERTLSTGERQQVLVTARYSDGRTEDVTRLAKFVGTNASVATVDDNGLVKATGNGEGTVRMSFTNTDNPTTVLDHYGRSAADAGYGDIVRTGTSLNAKKDDKSFAVEIGPDGNGSKGTITITGKDND